MKPVRCQYRDSTVKAWKYRKSGYIPAIIYGKGIEEPICIYGEEYVFIEMLWQSDIGSEVVLDLEGRSIPAIIKEISLAEETNRLEHMDFMVKE